MRRIKRPRGEAVVSAKMTREKVRRLRRDYTTGRFSQKTLAAKYGIGQTQVCYILSRRYWR